MMFFCCFHQVDFNNEWQSCTHQVWNSTANLWDTMISQKAGGQGDVWHKTSNQPCFHTHNAWSSTNWCHQVITKTKLQTKAEVKSNSFEEAQQKCVLWLWTLVAGAVVTNHLGHDGSCSDWSSAGKRFDGGQEQLRLDLSFESCFFSFLCTSKSFAETCLQPAMVRTLHLKQKLLFDLTAQQPIRWAVLTCFQRMDVKTTAVLQLSEQSFIFMPGKSNFKQASSCHCKKLQMSTVFQKWTSGTCNVVWFEIRPLCTLRFETWRKSCQVCLCPKNGVCQQHQLD